MDSASTAKKGECRNRAESDGPRQGRHQAPPRRGPERHPAPKRLKGRILDNLKAHGTRLIHEWLVKRPRFHLHFTPTSASWLNMVECWSALRSRRRLKHGAFTSTADLETAILAYIAETSATPRPFVWIKAGDDIFASVARFYQGTSNSGH